MKNFLKITREDLEELDPFLDEAANITYDMLDTGKYAIHQQKTQ